MAGELIERPLVTSDIAAAAALSAAAGWNQVADDWRVMLRHGWAIGFAADLAPAPVVATALALPVGERLAWISMVLVDATWRRRGLGTRLLERCIAQLTDGGAVAGLDATPAGRLVYEPLGFRALHGIVRLLVPRLADLAAPTPAGTVLRPLEADDLDALTLWDSTMTGMRRRYLLEHLHGRLPAAAWLALRGERIAGYLLGRDGRLSNQLGPLVAEDEATARALLAEAARATATPAILDVPDAHGGFEAWLHGLGAVTQRGYTRMVLGADAMLAAPDWLYAIGGPELG